MRSSVHAILSLLLAFTVLPSRAADDDIRAELARIRKEVEDLRKEKAASKPVGASVVDKVVDNKYGPNAPVTAKQGKLTLGGLIQVWYYSIQNDNIGFFGDRAGGKPYTAATAGDTNEFKDNDSFALRRTQLKFTMDIHENVTGYVMIDPTMGFVNRASFFTNLGTSLRSATATVADAAPANGTTRLQDAFINYHGVIPHHDFQIGQYKPFIGSEGMIDNANLEFAERSMIGQLTDARDIGLTMHGTWWDERFQYWIGTFNTPTSFLNATNQNRADNNDDKSLAARMLVRPVWKDEKWGSLELGASGQWNKLGEAGGNDLGTVRVDGLNVPKVDEDRYYLWAEYRPGGPVKGWWMKGEYAKIRGLQQSGKWALTALNGTTYWVMSTTANQIHPRAFDTDGWYVSTGYKLENSVFRDDLPSWFKPFEFCFRYETYGNVQVAALYNGLKDLDPLTAGLQGYTDFNHNVWKSSIFTAGVNYYIKGTNAKIQVDYSWVHEPAGAHDGSLPTPRLIRNVRNDNLLVNFQVAW